MKEFPSFLSCKGWRQILWNNKVSIISIPGTISWGHFYCRQLFIWETIIDRNRVIRNIFQSRQIVSNRILSTLPIYDMQIKLLQKQHPSNKPRAGPRLGVVWAPCGPPPALLLAPGVFWQYMTFCIFSGNYRSSEILYLDGPFSSRILTPAVNSPIIMKHAKIDEIT